MVVVPFIFVILNIPIVGIIVNISHIGVIFGSSVLSFPNIFPLEIISQGRVLIKSHSFKFTIGVETKDHREEIIGKTNDGHGIVESLLLG